LAENHLFARNGILLQIGDDNLAINLLSYFSFFIAYNEPIFQRYKDAFPTN